MRSGYVTALAFALLLSPAVAFAQGGAGTQPNMVFIMADDHPWCAYGFMKAIQDSGTFPVPTQHPDFPPIHTPNLDRLAARGAVFPVAASGQSKCIPSYRSAMTGLYPTRDNNEGGDRIPTHLARSGYISYGYGKLWATYDNSGFTHGGLRDWDLPRETLDPVWTFLDTRSPDDPPWFLWYSPRLPHQGYRFSEQYRDLFPREIFTQRSVRAQRHYANIMLLDYWIGQLLDGIAERGLDNNTLIVFMSDNGFLMRNSKDRHGENGFRTPILVSYPAKIPANLVMPQMVHAIDILPTLLDYAGGPIPAELEGETMRPYFENPSLPGREYLFSFRRGDSGEFLRTRDGLRFGRHGKREMLYDLTIDPDEKNNLIKDLRYKEKLPAWREALDAFRGSIGGPD